MRFHNGYWLLKEGVGCFSPQQVYEVKKDADSLTFLGPTVKVHDKGDTLGCIMLTVRISAPMEGVIRVQTWHHKGLIPKGPDFVLDLSQDGRYFHAQETEESLVITSGRLSLVIAKNDFSMAYYREEKLLTRSASRDLAYMKTDWRGSYAYDKGIQDAWMRQQLSLSVDEKIYGLGERFGAFVKNGQSIRIWNEDGGTSSEQAYKNIPFYLSDRDYGVLVNHPESVEFEIGTEQVSKVGFAVKGEYLDYFLFEGASMKEVLRRYTDLTGKPALPPEWTFGLWLSTSFTTDYDENTVMHFIDGMAERGIPLSVFHFDCCWMREFHWTDFIWDQRVFPDPEAMLSRIHQKGIHVCVWINPYIAQASALFDEGMEKGYFVRRPDGSVWQWDMWQPGMALVDFTNPKARAWFQDGLKQLLDMGVDCFKTDFGERIPTDVVYYDGSDPQKMHNFYTYLYNETVFELLRRERGENEAVVFARSATCGGQKFPVHWGGDCFSDYVSMEQSLRGGLSLTSSGFGFWSHDIGGFESKSTADVYKRWAAFGLLSTHSRLHGSSSYRVPWNYDDEAVDVVRFFSRLKRSFLPYLYSQAVHTARTGIPLMRSMALEFEGDNNCRYLDKQYMLGSSLLVAPVLNEDGFVSYYLPQGRWTNYLTGESCEGGCWRKEKHEYLSIPLWVRPNSLIPVLPFDEEDMETAYDHLELRAYEISTAGAVARVYHQGRGTLSATVKLDGTELLATIRGGDALLRLINRSIPEDPQSSIQKDGNDTLIPLYSPQKR
ncbi:MAG: alpha-xylosidase [Blautia sp.]|nr:alpha-xylosidase [Blautia sp.]